MLRSLTRWEGLCGVHFSSGKQAWAGFLVTPPEIGGHSRAVLLILAIEKGEYPVPQYNNYKKMVASLAPCSISLCHPERLDS